MNSQKVTSAEPGASSSAHGRWYNDACGTAFAMELIGERWSMLVLRELMLGPRRFSDLRASLPGISAKVLTERLAGLEQAGVLIRRKLPPPAPAQVYELTRWGYAAEAPIVELGRWAAMSAAHDPQLPLSTVGLMLSLRSMMVPHSAEGLALTVGFAIAGEHFVGAVADGALAVRRAAPEELPGADCTFAADAPLPLLRLFYGHRPLAEMEQAGVTVTGDRALAERFAGAFALPEKIG